MTAVSVSAFSPQVRALVRARAGGRCEICGTAVHGDLHHRLPRGSGGSADPAKGRPSNALCLCQRCHDLCECNEPVVFTHGWKLKHGPGPDSCPLLVPALLVTPYGKAYWLLDDDGNYVPPTPLISPPVPYRA